MKALAKRSLATAAALLAGVWAASAAAQFPERVVSIYVGYPPGGTADRTARVLAPVMERNLKQTVIVENKPGATQVVAARAALAAKPDGHTMLLVAEVDFVAKMLSDTSLGFGAGNFTSVCGTSFTPYFMVMRPDAPWKTVDELVAHLKKNPTSLTYGSIGLGSGHHMVMEFFQQQAGVKFTHVPYQGGGPVVAAMLGGQIDTGGGTWGLWRAQVLAGKVKPLIVLGRERMQELPDVPSFGEKGYSTGMSRGWIRLLVRKETPSATVAKLAEACEGLKRDTAAQEALRKSGLDPQLLGPAETARLAGEDEEAIRGFLGSLRSAQ